MEARPDLKDMPSWATHLLDWKVGWAWAVCRETCEGKLRVLYVEEWEIDDEG